MAEHITGYPSIDEPWLKYYSEEEIHSDIPQKTFYQNVYDNNKAFPQSIAVNYFGKKMTFEGLFERVDRCAYALHALGVAEKDCVTLCTVGTPETIILVLACNKIGALANFINPLFTEKQMSERINETGAKILFVLDRLAVTISNGLKNTCIEQVIVIPVAQSMPVLLKTVVSIKGNPELKKLLRNDKRYSTWEEFISKGKGAAKEQYDQLTVGFQKNTPAIMVYSSGTTGASKGIVLCNEGINATIAHSQVTSHQHKRGDTFLQMIPVWFSTGIVLSVLMPLTLGITVIPEPVFGKESFVKDLAKYRPTMTLGATSLWRYAISSPKLRSTDFSQMTFPMSGGEAIRKQDNEEIKEFLRSHGCKATFFVGYGMCELGSQVTSSTVKYEGKEGSAGIPILHARVSAFDTETNEEKRCGERGEIRVDSPARMIGYYKNPRATEEFFYTDSKGSKWGKTGDIGYVDEDGNVFVLGRATDNFISDDGQLVYCFDAESVILQDSRVSACKVLGISNGTHTIPVAHIMLRSEKASVEVFKAIDSLCRKELPLREVPMAYKFRDSFPVHSNGKRDIQALSAERDGFVDLDGKPFQFDA